MIWPPTGLDSSTEILMTPLTDFTVLPLKYIWKLHNCLLHSAWLQNENPIDNMNVVPDSNSSWILFDHGLDTWGAEPRRNSCVCGPIWAECHRDSFFLKGCISSEFIVFQTSVNNTWDLINFSVALKASFLKSWCNLIGFYLFLHWKRKAFIWSEKIHIRSEAHREKDPLQSRRPCLFRHTFVIPRHLNLHSVRNRMDSQKQREKLKV